MSGRKRKRPRPEPTNGPLKSRQVMIKSHRPELEPRGGDIYECPCGCNKFLLWRINSHRSPHLQCVRCGAVFCTGPECNHEDDEDRELRAEMKGKPSPDDKG